MPDPKFKIIIEGNASGAVAAAKQTTTALHDVGSTTQEVGKASEAAAESTAEHGKSFIHASNGAKEFKKALHLVTEEMPILGLVFKAAMSPIGAAFLASMMVYKSGMKDAEEAEKEFQELQKQTAEDIEKVRQALANTSEATGRAAIEYGKWKENLIKDSDEAGALDAILQKIKLQTEESHKLKEIEKQRALGDVDAKERLGPDAGGISQEQAARERIAIEQRYRDSATATDAKARMAEIQEMQQAIAQAKLKLPELRAQADAAQVGGKETVRLAELDNAQKLFEGELSKKKKAADLAQSQYKLAVDAAAQGEEIARTSYTGDTEEARQLRARDVEDATKRLNEALDAVAGLEKNIENVARQRADIASRELGFDKNREKAKEELAATAQFIAQKTEELNRLKNANTIRSAGESERPKSIRTSTHKEPTKPLVKPRWVASLKALRLL